jgi:hypothetical protein
VNYFELRKNTLTVTKTPLPGYRITNMIDLFSRNKYSFGLRYLPRVLYSLCLSSIMVPFRIKEKIKFDDKIYETEIKHSPVFILGHWRSGTTYIHNVISLDNNFGYFTTFQAYLPTIFLGSEKMFKSILERSLPVRRPMDDVLMGINLPQEDEYAVGGLSPYEYYHGWCFPKNMDYFNQFVCFENVSSNIIEEWKKIYTYLIKKVTLYWKGKRLVIKNPSNTARIKQLLEIYPNAKFIFIIRNPYDMYYSMMKFMRIVIPLYCVQVPPSIEKIEKSMMNLYTQMFKRYKTDRRLIPKGNLIELKYNDFIKNPFNNLIKIYENLNLENFDSSEKKIRIYLKKQKNIKTDYYMPSKEVIEKVNDKWRFVFEEFGFDILNS